MHIADTRFYKEMLKDFEKFEFKPTKRILVDARCLQDFRIGALILSMPNGESDYQSMMTCMEMYNNSIDKHTMNHFPGIDVTDDELECTIKDPELVEAVSLASPTTTIYDELSSLIYEIRKHNAITQDRNNIIPQLIINNEEFEYPDKAKAMLIDGLSSVISQSHIEFTTEQLKTVSIDWIKKFDMFILYDIEELFGREDMRMELMDNHFFFDIPVLAALRLDDDVANLDEEKLTDSISKTSMVLGLMCQFNFITPGIPIGPKGESTQNE